MILFLIACASDTTFSGTFVGNPGKGNTQIASSDGIAFSRASTNLQYVYYFKGDSEFIHAPNQEINLLDASSEIPIQAGNWDSIVFEMEPGISMEGSADGQQDFTWDLPSLFIKLDFEEPGIEEGTYLLSFGQPNWLAAEEIIERGDGAVSLSIEEDEEFSNMLVDNLETESALYSDSNGDGVISEEEQEQSIATGDDLDDDDEFDPWDVIDPFWQE